MMLWLGVLSTAGVFLLELASPLGIAIGVLYTVPILIGLWISNRRYIHITSLSSTLFVVASYLFTPQGDESWNVTINCILSLIAIWISAAICLLQKRTQDTLNRKNSLMRLLKSVAIAANEAETVESALQEGLTKVCSVMSWPVGHAYLLGDDPDTLIPTTVWHLDTPAHFEDFVRVTEKTPRASGSGLPGRVLQSGKPAWSADVTQDPGCPRSKAALIVEIRGGYAFPLLIKDRVLGVLEFFSAKVAEPDDLLLEVMASIGIQLGRVVERSRIQETEKTSRSNLEKCVQDRTAELSRINHELQNEILAHKRAEEEADCFNRQRDMILTSAAEGIFGLDLSGRFTFVNPAAARLFGRPDADIIGQPVEVILNHQKNKESETPESPIYNALRNCISYRVTDEVFCKKDGSSFPVEYTCTSSMDYGTVAGVVITFKNIAERKHAEKQREKLLLDLEHVNNELKEFAYIVSHDLKEPVRGVSSLAQWIAEDYAKFFDDSGRAQMQLLIDNTKRMHKLIDGILTYCRIGREKLELAKLDLREVVDVVINSLKIPDHIRVSAPGKLPVVQFYPLHLEQILQNLISNAIKHLGKPCGEVIISCRNAGEVWEICVQDNGIGIEERHYDRIFKLFQVLKKEDNYADSTGIGLALVKKIAEIHGEEVWVESQVGKGTAFFFTITKTFEEG